MSTPARATRGLVATLCLAVAIGGSAAAAPSAPLPASPTAGRVHASAPATGPSGRAQAAATTARQVAETSAAAATAPRRRTAARTIRIRHYTDAPGSQRAIDACRLVLWTLRPLWLAGHNYCGYQWLAHVRVGTVVRVTSGRAAGRYVVTGHRRLSRQSGALPRISADLVLQTCVGHGTGLTLARRLR